MAVEPSAKRARTLDTAALREFEYQPPKVIAEIECNHRGEVEVDVTETQVPFTEACKANTVRVRAVELGGGIEIRSACSSKSGWVSVDSSEVVLPPRQGCRLQISQDLYKGTRKWQVWYPRNKGDVHDSHSITGQENCLQECMDWAWQRHEAAWVSLFHICLHTYIVHMKKTSWTPSQPIERVSVCLDFLSFLTYIHKQIRTLFWACLCNVFDLFLCFLWLFWISYIHTYIHTQYIYTYNHTHVHTYISRYVRVRATHMHAHIAHFPEAYLSALSSAASSSSG